MSIWHEIRTTFRHGSNLTRLLYFNGAIFLIVKIVEVIAVLASKPLLPGIFIGHLAVPAFLPDLADRFWTPLTYMFLHQRFFHLLFNLMVLYWFGKIFLMYLDEKKLVALYLLGGLSGAIVYVAFFNLLPAFGNIVTDSVALGASASVMAIVVAIAVWAPENEILLFLFGRIRLKYLALFIFLLTTVFDFSVNTGGKIAHMGGALFGLIWSLSLKRGTDLGKGLNRIIDTLATILKPGRKLKVTHKKPPRSDYEYNRVRTEHQTEINRILDKISKAGYDSLTSEEKQKLFSESQGKN
ncbi:MAG: rhomboid family intramembrane serine protease [Bacteroidales bacterium]|jgi:membrane associated rhomboid family serine protease|nr:rhomboid family intramembrane serine protease [Bacteroidales bacterium]